MEADNQSSGPHEALRFMPEIEHAYNDYLQSIPLDLRGGSLRSVESWRNNNRLSRLAFAQLVEKLMNAENLDDFVKRSAADFDNLGPILEVSLRLKLISIDASGQIDRLLKIKNEESNAYDKCQKPIEPKSEFNQFPCDIASRIRRVALLKERYPNVEHLNVAIIGDDDLLSAELGREAWAKVVVFEKDPRIISFLKNADASLRIIEGDVTELEQETIADTVDTFITDPPYTLHGSLSFIASGLKFLKKNKEEKEFYVILNPTMMGHSLRNLHQILCECGISLKEVRQNFSQYELPDNFIERARSSELLQSNSIDPSALQYSSSSNLYIFSTEAPDICKLASYIDPYLIYTHYL